VRSGVDPNILEYVDKLTLAAISYAQNLNLGIPDNIREAAEAHLVIGVENRDHDRLDDDVTMLGQLLDSLGAMDLYVLEVNSAHALIEAREKAFWTAKAAGANDVIDVVLPRAQMHQFFTRAQELAQKAGALEWSGAGMPATATCTWRCSAATTTSATGCCTTSSLPRWSWAGRSPASTAQAGSRCDTSWSWRIRSRLR
jgi:FAD/FMN-containing dehydrogenase